jgi:glycosyltransferase involved in cell wall biosynthesis
MKAGRVSWENQHKKVLEFVLAYRPKITVVTVCFNEEAGIRETCQSILQQSYSSIEWIVVDGKSTDKTLEILNEFRSHIDYFVSEKDRGIYDAMNKGIAAATGDYVIFMNAGDGFVDASVISDCFETRTDFPDVVYGDALVSLGNNEQIVWKMNPQVTMDYLLSFAGINHQSAFISRSLFRLHGGYDLELKYASDSEKWCCFLSNNCRFEKVERQIALYKGFDGMSNNPLNSAKIQHEREVIISRYRGKK